MSPRSCPARDCTPRRSRRRGRSSPTCASSRARARSWWMPRRARTPGWQAMIKKFINPQLAPSKDETGALRAIGVFGATSRRIVATLVSLPPDALAALPVYAHTSVRCGRPDRDGDPLARARARGLRAVRPDRRFLGDLAEAARPGRHARRDCTRGRSRASRRAGPSGAWTWTRATIPQEANFDTLHAISYTKGCYMGQEVVARVHFRGHVNRHLRGLMAGKSEPRARGRGGARRPTASRWATCGPARSRRASARWRWA